MGLTFPCALWAHPALICVPDMVLGNVLGGVRSIPGNSFVRGVANSAEMEGAQRLTHGKPGRPGVAVRML